MWPGDDDDEDGNTDEGLKKTSFWSELLTENSCVYVGMEMPEYEWLLGAREDDEEEK